MSPPKRLWIGGESCDDTVLYIGSDNEDYDSPSERIRRAKLAGDRLLHGIEPVSISAALHGPFTETAGWHNPWRSRGRTAGANAALQRRRLLCRRQPRQDDDKAVVDAIPEPDHPPPAPRLDDMSDPERDHDSAECRTSLACHLVSPGGGVGPAHHPPLDPPPLLRLDPGPPHQHPYLDLEDVTRPKNVRPGEVGPVRPSRDEFWSGRDAEPKSRPGRKRKSKGAERLRQATIKRPRLLASPTEGSFSVAGQETPTPCAATGGRPVPWMSSGGAPLLQRQRSTPSLHHSVAEQGDPESFSPTLRPIERQPPVPTTSVLPTLPSSGFQSVAHLEEEARVPYNGQSCYPAGSDGSLADEDGGGVGGGGDRDRAVTAEAEEQDNPDSHLLQAQHDDSFCFKKRRRGRKIRRMVVPVRLDSSMSLGSPEAAHSDPQTHPDVEPAAAGVPDECLAEQQAAAHLTSSPPPYLDHHLGARSESPLPILSPSRETAEPGPPSQLWLPSLSPLLLLADPAIPRPLAVESSSNTSSRDDDALMADQPNQGREPSTAFQFGPGNAPAELAAPGSDGAAPSPSASEADTGPLPVPARANNSPDPLIPESSIQDELSLKSMFRKLSPWVPTRLSRLAGLGSTSSSPSGSAFDNEPDTTLVGTPTQADNDGDDDEDEEVKDDNKEQDQTRNGPPTETSPAAVVVVAAQGDNDEMGTSELQPQTPVGALSAPPHVIGDAAAAAAATAADCGPAIAPGDMNGCVQTPAEHHPYPHVVDTARPRPVDGLDNEHVSSPAQTPRAVTSDSLFCGAILEAADIDCESIRPGPTTPPQQSGQQNMPNSSPAQEDGSRETGPAPAPTGPVEASSPPPVSSHEALVAKNSFIFGLFPYLATPSPVPEPTRNQRPFRRSCLSASRKSRARFGGQSESAAKSQRRVSWAPLPHEQQQGVGGGDGPRSEHHPHSPPPPEPPVAELAIGEVDGFQNHYSAVARRSGEPGPRQHIPPAAVQQGLTLIDPLTEPQQGLIPTEPRQGLTPTEPRQDLVPTESQQARGSLTHQAVAQESLSAAGKTRLEVGGDDDSGPVALQTYGNNDDDARSATSSTDAINDVLNNLPDFLDVWDMESDLAKMREEWQSQQQQQQQE